MTTPKINNLTGVRAFAALWVILLHFSDNTGIKGVLDLGPFVSHGAWGVDVFFVLSGLILSYTHGHEPLDGSHYRFFIVKRFARLYPLHLATFMLMVVVWLVARSVHYEFQSPAEYSGYTAFLHLLMVHAWGLSSHLSWNGVSWSASAEWFAYLFIFPLCILVAGKLSAGRLVVLVAVLWVMLLLLADRVYGKSVTEMTNTGYLRIVPEFIAGYLVFREAGRFKMPGDLGAILGALMLVGGVLLNIELIVLPAIMLMLLGLYKGGRVGNAVFGNPVAVFLGDISYSLYLTHGFVKTASDQFIRRLGTGLAPYWLLAVDILMAVLVAFVFYAVVERPCRQWIVKRYVTKFPKQVAIQSV